MSSLDPWGVLGLEPGASAEAIKAAYRRIARESHPDRNPGDRQAEERFRQAAEAYRALTASPSGPPGTSEPKTAGGDPSSPPDGETTSNEGVASEVFGKVFGRRRRPKRERGVDLRYNLRLGFTEAARGGERLIRVPGKATCKRCGGTGAELGSSPIICHRCRGEGSVPRRTGFFESWDPCPECQGRGRLQTDPCRVCQGLGEVDVEREIPVALPQGVSSGTRLRVAGEGQPGKGGGEPGDLFVVIEVDPHPLFERDGDDLLLEVPISFAMAVLGGHVRIPTLDGIVRLRVPPGSGSGRVLRLKGKGFGGGDQRVTLRVETPKSLSETARASLEAYAAAEAKDGALAAVSAFREAVERFEAEDLA